MLTCMRGLPGSGKTTKALELLRARQAADRPCVRSNRDELRAMMFARDGRLSHPEEEAVTAAQRAIITAALAAGKDVIVDNTNLRARDARAVLDLAVQHGVPWEVIDVDTPLEECIRRDAARRDAGGRWVGEDVIRGMHSRFLPRGFPPIVPTPQAPTMPAALYVGDPTLPPAWLIDIDGTLALMREGGRSPYDWHRVGEDDPNPAVIDLVRALGARGDAIIVMSGRDEVCRETTEEWLDKHLGWYSELFLRPEGDQRRDAIVKRELFDQHVAHRWDVLGVIDDRQQVVDMWRAMGLMCAQVAPGDF